MSPKQQFQNTERIIKQKYKLPLSVYAFLLTWKQKS